MKPVSLEDNINDWRVCEFVDRLVKSPRISSFREESSP